MGYCRLLEPDTLLNDSHGKAHTLWRSSHWRAARGADCSRLLQPVGLLHAAGGEGQRPMPHEAAWLR